MDAWPSTLPSPTIQQYEAAQQNSTIRTEMEAGTVRVRRYSAAVVDRAVVAWVFTDAQMAEFRVWYALHEVAWFTTEMAMGDGSITIVSARFMEPWQATLLPGNNWSVSAPLEIE